MFKYNHRFEIENFVIMLKTVNECLLLVSHNMIISVC